MTEQLSVEWINEFRKYYFAELAADADFDTALAIKEVFTPKTIYQYRAFSDRSIQNIENDTVWLAKPSTFNDPYDCMISFDEDRLLKEHPEIFLSSFPEEVSTEVLRRLKDNSDVGVIEMVARYHFEKINREDRRKRKITLDSIIAGMRESHKSSREKIQETLDKQRDNIGICCFSKRNNSHPMWAHYADNHKGYCVEYDISNEYEIIDNLLPVVYRHEIYDSTYVINRSPEYNSMRLLEMTMIKSHEWSYEEEWRLVMQGKSGVTFKMPKIKSIYLGKNMLEPAKELITQKCIERSINVFLMSRNMTKFELIATPL